MTGGPRIKEGGAYGEGSSAMLTLTCQTRPVTRTKVEHKSAFKPTYFPPGWTMIKGKGGRRGRDEKVLRRGQAMPPDAL